MQELTKFEEFWNIHPSGAKTAALEQFEYARDTNKIPEDILIAKMRQYIDRCKAQKTDAKFIKSSANWLRDEFYHQSFQMASGSTLSYLEKWLEGYL